MRFRAVLIVVVATIASVLVSGGSATAAPSREVTPVPAVDLVRYQGTWLQLAAIPQPFQAQCARNDQANYTLLPDGTVRVLNSCTRADGGVTTLEGRARPAVAGSTSRLEVSFVNTGNGWDFSDPGTYWVIGLDAQYRWAVVGAPDRRSGFVLSRSARPALSDVVGIVRTLISNGYDPCAFRITAQSGGAPGAVDLC